MKPITLLAEQRTDKSIFRLMAAGIVCAALAIALGCTPTAAWANEQNGLENSWRYANGQRIDTWKATMNCNGNQDGTESAAASKNTAPSVGIMNAQNPKVVTVGSGDSSYKVWDGFAVFTQGYCTGKTSSCGVDVSEHNCTGNKAPINWAKAKADGVDFAIIRCGYGSEWTTGGTMVTNLASTAKRDPAQDDKAFLTNVKACQQQGIPFGIYLYSYASTKSEAVSEAVHTIRVLEAAGLKPTDLAYPVFYDLEDSALFDGCSNTVAAKKARLNTLASAYFETMEAAGWINVGTYASTSWWNDYLVSSTFTSHAYWVAEWNTKSGLTYKGLSDFTAKKGTWQFSDSGVVAGIEGKVDLNYSDFKHTPGWESTAGGKRYNDANGHAVTGIREIDGKYYYFDKNGLMKTSCWYTYSDGKRSYFSKNGDAFTGWHTIGGYKFYFSKTTAKALKGANQLDGSWYYFDSKGHMLTSALKSCTDGHKRYYGEDGRAITGWKTIDGNKYYFSTKTMKDLHGKAWIGTKAYYFSSSGVMQVSKWGKWTYGDNKGKYSYFGKNGYMLTGKRTIKGVNYDLGETGIISIDATHLAMDKKAGTRSSNTKYLVLADIDNCQVGIYKGKKGSWACIKYWKCSPGAASSPTPTGTYTVTGKGYTFTSFGTRCYYYTQFYGDYLFHSVCYSPDGSKVVDGRLGKHISHGCVRLKTANAKWMYKYIPYGTKVYIYD